MATRVLTVGEAARRAGLTPRALRLYERLGILGPQPRTESGYRVYAEEDVALLRFVRRARDLGLALEDVRRIVDRRRRGTLESDMTVALLENQLDRLGQQARELTSRRDAVNRVLAHALLLADDGKAVHLCEVTESALDHGLRPGPR